MSTQNGWKEFYKMFVIASCSDRPDYAAELRNDMWSCRREATLERRCEMLERQVEAQAQRIAELESDLEEYQIQEYQVVFPAGE